MANIYINALQTVGLVSWTGLHSPSMIFHSGKDNRRIKRRVQDFLIYILENSEELQNIFVFSVEFKKQYNTLQRMLRNMPDIVQVIYI